MRTLLGITIAIMSVLGTNAAGAPPQLATKKALTLDVAKAMVKISEQEAEKNNWKVCIAVLDDGGNLLYFERMDGVQIGSIEVSQRKAESALKFKRPSKAFADRVATQPGVMTLPGTLPVEGGLPIIHEGEVIGAVGVSGVESFQDAQIAKAGIDALPKILGK